MPETVLEALNVVNAPAAAAVPPIAGGDAKYVEKPVPDTVEDALKVVNAPVLAVPLPIAPGEANVAPPNELALRLATFVVDATVNGAVPVAMVDSIVVNLPVLGAVPPIAGGDAK